MNVEDKEISTSLDLPCFSFCKLEFMPTLLLQASPCMYSVIRRLITMLGNVATLEASHTATLRQAQAANAELARRIDKESSEVLYPIIMVLC